MLVENPNAQFNLTDSTFQDNLGKNSGALFIKAGYTRLENVTFVDNVAS